MLVGLTVLVGLLVVVAVLHLRSARDQLLIARSDLTAARRALAAGDRAGGAADLDQADAELVSARHEAGSFPLGVMRPVPGLGSPARAARGAVMSGMDAVAAGRILLNALHAFPIANNQGLDGHDLANLRAAAGEATTALRQAKADMLGADRRLAGPSSALLPQIADPARAMRAEVRRTIASVDGAARGLDLLTRLTAPSADYRILVLSQDSLELRPTGGYIGSVGILHFSHGTVALEDYVAGEDLPPPSPPLSPPPDLAPVLPKWWGVSNANWWPGFPTSAQTAAELYSRQGGGRVDGVVALTEYATERLLSALGPIKLPDYAEPVVADGFDQRTVYEVELKRPLDTPRKKFLIELSQTLFNRMTHLPSGQLPGIVKALDASVAAGDVQLWFADPSFDSSLAGRVISGALPRTASDFLMLVDANVTASKANQGVTKQARYNVQRRSDGRLEATLTVVVHDNEPASPINPFYNGFLRVYVPAGSQLLGHVAKQGLDGSAPDGPYAVFSQVLDVPAQGSQTVTFDYVLPASVDPEGAYRLTWVRQVGTPGDQLTADVAGRSADVPTTARVLTVTATFGDRSLRGWLHRRWIVRALGL